MGALFAVEFPSMGDESVIERLAVNVLRVVGQMISDGRRQIAVDSIRHSDKCSAPAGMLRYSCGNRRCPALR
jgi:hypothetical protein